MLRLLDRPFSAFILDKDGTLVRFGKAIPGANEFMTKIQQEGTPYVVLSNTGEKNSSDVASELSFTLGLSIPKEKVYTAREHLVLLLEQKSVHVRCVGRNPPSHLPCLAVGAPVPEDCSAIIVAVFSDGAIDDFLRTAETVVQYLTRGAKLYTTSSDASLSYTKPDGSHGMSAGPGVFCNAVLTMMRWKKDHPRFVIAGKGGKDVTFGLSALRMLKEQGFGGDERKVLVVGDRFDTDVRMGVHLRCSTCLVESGCHTLDEHAALYPSDMADMVASSVRDLATRDGGFGSVTELIRDVIREVARDSIRHRRLHVLKWIRERVEASSTFSLPPRRVRSVPWNLELESE